MTSKQKAPLCDACERTRAVRTFGIASRGTSFRERFSYSRCGPVTPFGIVCSTIEHCCPRAAAPAWTRVFGEIMHNEMHQTYAYSAAKSFSL